MLRSLVGVAWQFYGNWLSCLIFQIFQPDEVPIAYKTSQVCHAIALIDFKGELPDKLIKDIHSSMYLRDGYWGNDYGFSSGLVIRNQGLVGVVISNN